MRPGRRRAVSTWMVNDARSRWSGVRAVRTGRAVSTWMMSSRWPGKRAMGRAGRISGAIATWKRIITSAGCPCSRRRFILPVGKRYSGGEVFWMLLWSEKTWECRGLPHQGHHDQVGYDMHCELSK